MKFWLGKGICVLISEEFELSEFELSGFYCSRVHIFLYLYMYIPECQSSAILFFELQIKFGNFFKFGDAYTALNE